MEHSCCRCGIAISAGYGDDKEEAWCEDCLTEDDMDNDHCYWIDLEQAVRKLNETTTSNSNDS